MAAGSAHCLLLQVSKATLFQENSGWSAACQESFRPLFTSYVNSRERKLRQKLLEQYFSLDGLLKKEANNNIYVANMDVAGMYLTECIYWGKGHCFLLVMKILC